MGRARTIARRGFLIGSAALAGGVAFGVWAVRRPHANPLLEGLAEGEAALTPYVLIAPDGITLIAPRADKGQGATSVQAMLIAEELDVELSQVRVDPGPPSPAYWNTALSAEAADFMAPGGGMAADAAHLGVDAVMKLMGMQITGGSTTVPDGFDKLRRAGASARETLKRAAAAETGIDVLELRTEGGAVLLPDGRRLPYTDLAARAATLEVVQDVPLRAPSEWRLIGRPLQRIDIVAKSTGTLRYGIDGAQADMAHATVLLGPAPGTGLRSFDAAEALAMRGVKAVVPVTGGLGIVADNTWRAFQAAQAITAQWDAPPFPATMQDQWQALSQAFDEDSLDSRKRDDGDVEAVLTEGETLSAEYRAPYLAHAPLEPINAIVRVTDDGAEVWTGTQIPRLVQHNVARIAGLSPDRVRVHAQYIGGSFGHRLEDQVVRHAAEIAVRMKGTPVKLTYARETDMAQDFPRQIAMARMRGRVRDGRVEALDLGIAMPSVMASQMGRQDIPVPGPDSQIVAGAWDQPFAIPHQRVTGYRAPELVPISSWRSVGASSGGFFYNAALGELIAAAGADPLEERLRLCNDRLARAVLEAVAEMSDWQGPRAVSGRGRGVALTHSFGVPCAEVVEVEETPAGLRVTRAWVAAEVGRVVDPVNFENQVAGGVLWGLGHAMNCAMSYEDGAAEPLNYHAHDGMRMRQCPLVEARGLQNGPRVLGVGEPPVPPAAPALAGAIYALTGQRLREMPFDRFVTFA